MPYRNIFKKILFCTDFNTDAMKAFHYTLNIAEGNTGSEIIMFHVIPEPDAQFWKSYIYEVEDVDDKAKQDIDRKIAADYIPLIPEGVSWSTRYVIGNVGEEILKEAKKENVDIIIIGRGSGKNVINRMLGNYTEKLIRKAKRPVLVIPETAEEAE